MKEKVRTKEMKADRKEGMKEIKKKRGKEERKMKG